MSNLRRLGFDTFNGLCHKLYFIDWNLYLVLGVFTSLIVILAIQFLSPVFNFAPMAALAAIVIAAIIKLFDYQLALKLWKLNKFDFLLWIATFFGCLYEIEVGIMVGVILSLCLVLHREFKPRLNLSVNRETRKLIVALRGGVWFPGIASVAGRISKKFEKEGGVIDVVVIDCKDMLEIDYSVLHGLQEIAADCLLNNARLEFENVHGGKIRRMLEGENLIKTSTDANGDHPLEILETGRLMTDENEHEAPLVSNGELGHLAEIENETVA